MQKRPNESLNKRPLRSNLDPSSVLPPAKRQKTNSSLLELCEREEWTDIIESVKDFIHTWDFDERNADNNSPLHICCAKGSLNVLQHFQQAKTLDFKESKGKNGDSCVLLAARNGHLETVKWLLENGCSTNERNEYGNTCLLLACSNGQLETLKWLIDNGCSINERNNENYSCLLLAAYTGHLETVKWLIENGCSINERNDENDSCLLLACSNGHLETAKWLIKKGCSIHERNDDQSNCILQASRGGNIESIQWLLKQGCSLQDTNKHGTCVMNAALCEQTDAVIWMLSNGSSISENTIKTTSCEAMLKTNGIYHKISSIYKTKSSRK